MKKYAIGLDIGGTDLKIGLVSDSGTIISNIEAPTDGNKPAKIILENIRNGIERLLAASRVSMDQIWGIGAGTPGLVDDKGCVIAGSPNMKHWAGTDLGGFLRKTFKTDVVAENDVTSLAMGEALFGNGKPFRHFISLAFGTGLGGGIIIDRKIYRGKNGYAAEIGHIRVNDSPEAPYCNCGIRGCLETYASATGIGRMLREGIKDFPSTHLSADSTPRHVYELAGKRDRLALKIVKEVGYRLGIGMGILVNTFDPEAVILGGGIARAGRIFTDAFMPVYLKSVLDFYHTHKVKFLPAKLGKEGGIVGTASLIFQRHGKI